MFIISYKDFKSTHEVQDSNPKLAGGNAAYLATLNKFPT